jgi:hypothetical protein
MPVVPEPSHLSSRVKDDLLHEDHHRLDSLVLEHMPQFDHVRGLRNLLEKLFDLGRE